MWLIDTPDTLVLDETRPVGTETDGDSAPAGLDTVTVNLADNFAAVPDFGSDGPGSATYSLVLTGSNVASGLFALDAADTTAGDLDGIGQGAQIVLNQSGNTITGSAGGTNYFTITLNPATGQVTFTPAQQHLARQHRQRRRHRNADIGERQPADAGADGDRCRRRR